MLHSDIDPLSIAWAPPTNESPQEKAERLQREADAQRVSDAIDESLRAERAAMKKSRLVRILLLGQSESGKSTTLKNLQMAYAPEAWAQQRASWRSIIQLNIVHSINTILDIMSLSHTPTTRAASPFTSPHPSIYSRLDPEEDGSGIRNNSRSETPTQLTDKHMLLRLRLGPLRSVENDLRCYLGATLSDIESVEVDAEQWATPFEAPMPDLETKNGSERRRLREFFIRAQGSRHSSTDDIPEKKPRGRGVRSVTDEATDIIAECADDMKALWEDETVRALLESSGVLLWQGSGFFLDSIDRITSRSYSPSDRDIVRTRLRTIGVQEHHLVLERDTAPLPEDKDRRKSKEGSAWSKENREWVIYDVGGSRTSRNAWLPYFTDLTAIIFLAPLSCFDEMLVEDPKVNRMEDSFQLWTAVVSSKLLAKVMVILFMNKCDLFDRKLKAGIKLNAHLLTYGDRSNSSGTAVKYLRNTFKSLMVDNSPSPRPFYGYPTSVVDTEETALVLQSVYDCIIRAHLKKADFV